MDKSSMWAAGPFFFAGAIISISGYFLIPISNIWWGMVAAGHACSLAFATAFVCVEWDARRASRELTSRVRVEVEPEPEKLTADWDRQYADYCGDQGLTNELAVTYEDDEVVESHYYDRHGRLVGTRNNKSSMTPR